jgi:hypothetical protein
MTGDQINEAHKALLASRGPDHPEDRHELREEVRITALLIVAQELEFLSTALTAVAERIQAVTANVDFVIQNEVREADD